MIHYQHFDIYTCVFIHTHFRLHTVSADKHQNIFNVEYGEVVWWVKQLWTFRAHQKHQEKLFTWLSVGGKENGGQMLVALLMISLYCQKICILTWWMQYVRIAVILYWTYFFSRLKVITYSKYVPTQESMLFRTCEMTWT